MTRILTCRELVEFLHEYLAGELSPARHAEFEEHLAACPSCVSYMKSYQASIRLGKAALAASEEPVSGVPEELVRAILAARTRES